MFSLVACGVGVRFDLPLEACPVHGPCGEAMTDAHGAMADARVPDHGWCAGHSHVGDPVCERLVIHAEDLVCDVEYLVCDVEDLVCGTLVGRVDDLVSDVEDLVCEPLAKCRSAFSNELDPHEVD